MTKKDQSVSENIDLGSKKNENTDAADSAKKSSSEMHTSDEIKNAHATGDGAYGRSDKSVFARDESKSGAAQHDQAY